MHTQDNLNHIANPPLLPLPAQTASVHEAPAPAGSAHSEEAAECTRGPQMPVKLADIALTDAELEFLKTNSVPSTVMPKSQPRYPIPVLTQTIRDAAPRIIKQARGQTLFNSGGLLNGLHGLGLCTDLQRANSIGDALGSSGLNLPRVHQDGRMHYDLRGIDQSDEVRAAIQTLLNARAMMKRRSSNRPMGKRDLRD